MARRIINPDQFATFARQVEGACCRHTGNFSTYRADIMLYLWSRLETILELYELRRSPEDVAAPLMRDYEDYKSKDNTYWRPKK